MVKEMIKQFSISCDVEIKFKETWVTVEPKPEPETPEPTFPIQKIVPGEVGESTIVIGTIDEKTIPVFVNTMLEFLVVKNIIDVPTANRILVTFKITGKGRFNTAGAQPLTPETISTLPIRADPKTKQRFIELLTVLIANPVPTKIAHFLLTILLDSGTINMKTADTIMTVYRITGKIRFEVIEAVEEPPLVPGKDPGANKVHDSTVTITQVTGDLPPLIKRLTDLNVNAKIMSPTVKADFLTTFSLSVGGTPITPATVAKLTLGGKAQARNKFVKNLTPTLSTPTAPAHQKTLVKILMELLLDNAAIDYASNSLGKFAAAYGVGTSTRVVTTTG
jgi:hypothetical protein